VSQDQKWYNLLGAKALELEPLSSIGAMGLFTYFSGQEDPLAAKQVEKKQNLVNHVNTWFWPGATLAGMSSFAFLVYIGRVTNSHEWKEIYLDYAHHHRTRYAPNQSDKIARGILGLLRMAPK